MTAQIYYDLMHGTRFLVEYNYHNNDYTQWCFSGIDGVDNVLAIEKYI